MDRYKTSNQIISCPDIGDNSIFPGQDKRLWVGELEVGVIYMRCGYHPDQYPTQKYICTPHCKLHTANIT